MARPHETLRSWSQPAACTPRFSPLQFRRELMRITANLSLTLALLSACTSSQRTQPQPDLPQATAPSSASKSPRLDNPRTRCRENADCDPNAFCAHDLGLCGASKQLGLCTARPNTCSGHDPVCGCDGRVYDNACAARSAGADLSVTGRCKAVVPDFIPCGAHYCDAHRQYCEIYLSDVAELPTTSNCRPLPDACLPSPTNQRSCDCFSPTTPCRAFCGPTWTGGVPGFHLTCQGVKEPR
jgi:hypothetical protein